MKNSLRQTNERLNCFHALTAARPPSLHKRKNEKKKKKIHSTINTYDAHASK